MSFPAGSGTGSISLSSRNDMHWLGLASSAVAAMAVHEPGGREREHDGKPDRRPRRRRPGWRCPRRVRWQLASTGRRMTDSLQEGDYDARMRSLPPMATWQRHRLLVRRDVRHWSRPCVRENVLDDLPRVWPPDGRIRDREVKTTIKTTPSHSSQRHTAL
jgi:hypothetical protein